LDIQVLHADYQRNEGLANRCCSALRGELAQLLDARGVALGVPMQGRVKSWASVEEKLKRRSLELKSVKELDDLIGLRIILLFRRDLNAVCEIIEKSLKVVGKEDTGDRLGETQFGYQSLHYIIELPKEWLAVPTLKDFAGLRIEIQARTLAQHIWAASSHILQYKVEESVPTPVRRSIHRVSALLETVDLEFERVLQERAHYLRKEKTENPEEKLNVDLLAKALDDRLPDANKVNDEPYAELLEELKSCDITNLSELNQLIDKQLKTAKREDAKLASAVDNPTAELGAPAERRDRGVYYTHVGLLRTMLDQEFGIVWRETDYGLRKRRKRRTKRK
jgi:GTP pyrophosphokinase